MFSPARARAVCLVPLLLFLVPTSSVLAGAVPPSAASAPAAASLPLRTQSVFTSAGIRPTREVFGFATSGSLGDPTVGYPSWNFNLLSTVAFFAIHVQNTGVLIADANWSVWNSSTLTGLVSTAHAHGTKVVVTLVGPSARNLVDFCNALYNDDTTILQIVNQVKLKGIDGVNLDYEGQLGQCNPTNGFTPMTTQALMTRFAKDMRAGLDAVGPGYYLSIDTYSGSAAGNDGFFNIPDLNQYVDSFFVMAYDMDAANQGSPPLTCSSFCMAPVSPLTNYHWNDTTSMAQYSAVVGPGKTILGQPYYGRVACVGSPTAHAIATRNVSAATYLEAAAAITSPDVKAGTYAIHRDANDATGFDRWDTWYDNALGCWREMYWGDTTELGTRYNLVNQDNLRGVGFWTLNYGGGAGELWAQLQDYFVSCTGADVIAVPASPQLSATQIQLTATSSNCSSPLYEFWYLPPGGKWTLAQPYSANPAYKWNTTGKPAGSYLFSVWARAASIRGIYGSPPNTYDAFATLPYQLTTVPCAAVTASSSPDSTAAIGVPVSIAGSATGCPGALYEFWILPPGGSWSLAQPYSTNATLTWNTSGQRAGSYRFSVWVRDASSLGTAGSGVNTYDAFSGIQYALTVGACSVMSASSAPASTADVATPVTITAAAPGCSNPRYEFWLQAPGGSWTLAQSYSPNAVFNWATAGKAAGSYRFSVWAKDAASSSPYDSFSAFQYTLTTTPCTALSASQAPPTSAVVGSLVAITGTAAGCPNPQYEFWILPPGGTWTLARAYSSSTTFNWGTSGEPTGAYRVSVWVRDASSPAPYDAFSAFQYSLS